MSKSRVAVLLLILIVLGLGYFISSAYESSPRGHTHYLSYGGLDRSYLLFTPAHVPGDEKSPLLIVLHGADGDAAGLVKFVSPLSSYAKQKGVIVVYANGTGPQKDRSLTWNAATCCGTAFHNKIDDVGFIRTLIETLKKDYPVDESRIFIAGFSNGAMMAYRLGCELSDIVTGIAPVSGALDGECKPAHPVSVMAFHGTADALILYQGGIGSAQFEPDHLRSDEPESKAINFWTQYDHCPGTLVHKESGHIIQDFYAHCDSGTAVSFTTIVGGGHVWPGGNAYVGGSEPTREISASKEIVDFMLEHPRDNHHSEAP